MGKIQNDEEMLSAAMQDRPISRGELGIKNDTSKNGLQTLNEGVNILKFSDQNSNIYKGTE